MDSGGEKIEMLANRLLCRKDPRTMQYSMWWGFSFCKGNSLVSSTNFLVALHLINVILAPHILADQ